jgi:hypothetical protein
MTDDLERNMIFLACNNMYDLLIDSIREEIGHYYDEQLPTKFVVIGDTPTLGRLVKYYQNPDVKQEFIYKCTGQEAMDKFGDFLR